MKKLALIPLISLLIIGSPAADVHVDYSKNGNEPDTWTMAGDKIQEYLIIVDNHEL